VIDGIVAMEGLGPGLGEPKPLGLVLAGEDPIATDIAALFLMGFTAQDLPYLVLAASKQTRPLPGLDDLDLNLEQFMPLRSPFKRAVPEDISAQFPEFLITSGESCNACRATAMTFLRIYGKNYRGKEITQIAIGKKIEPGQIQKERCILLGNCTSKLQAMGIFLEGCPPIPSDILKAVNALKPNDG
jgi:hypothetical protein